MRMVTIKVRITRKENVDFYGVAIGDVVEVPLEEYVAAVVASEIGNSHIEACKAQAIAARTFAYPYYSKGSTISDASSTHQAYRAPRFNSTLYPNACKAAAATAGLVLTYNGSVIGTCSYSASNGGRTVSSEERWGGKRAWLIAQDDPWDAAAGTGRTGHGVGMSQRGAKYAAGIGISYDAILAFYYPGTTITQKEDETIMIKANELIALFQKALSEKWGYIWGAAGETWTQAKQNAATREQTVKYGQKWVGRRVSDCSGLFYWAFKQLGGYMYHGSNTMFKSYSTASGTLKSGKRSDGEELKPGTAVYKYNTSDGYHHVGLYVGNNQVIEAKGTAYGVVSSKPSDGWTHWGELKGVDYTNTEGGTSIMATVLYTATVTTQSGSLNVRKTASKSAAILGRLNKGTTVDVIEEGSGWLHVQSGSLSGWCDASFLTKAATTEEPAETEDKVYSAVITDSEGSTFKTVGAFTVRMVEG